MVNGQAVRLRAHQFLEDTRVMSQYVHSDRGSAPNDSQITMFSVSVGEKTHEVTFPQAFSAGHSLVKKKQFTEAATIFEKLVAAANSPCAHVMLAICKAGLSDYKGSRAVLDQAFTGEVGILSAKIHGVIVDSRMGFKADAIRELVDLVNQQKDYPVLSLWLGDLFEADQRLKKSIQCWKVAIKRDQPGGPVALAARQQLRRVENAGSS
jgi:hypothetical protein